MSALEDLLAILAMAGKKPAAKSVKSAKKKRA